jgi:hypothetical protein
MYGAGVVFEKGERRRKRVVDDKIGSGLLYLKQWVGEFEKGERSRKRKNNIWVKREKEIASGVFLNNRCI